MVHFFFYLFLLNFFLFYIFFFVYERIARKELFLKFVNNLSDSFYLCCLKKIKKIYIFSVPGGTFFIE